jgi:hypothetical protein
MSNSFSLSDSAWEPGAPRRRGALEKERRRHTRRPAGHAIRYRFVSGSEAGDAVLANLNGCGARVDFPHEVTVPADVILELPLSARNDQPESTFEVRGRVVWTVTDRREGPFPAGIAFVDVNDEIRAALEALVANLPG